MKSPKKSIILFCVVLIICSFQTVVIAANKVMYTKSDTILRKKDSQTSEAKKILEANSKVEILSTIKKSDGTVYNKVRESITNTEGYVLKRQLSNNKVSEYNNSVKLSKNNKLRIVKLTEYLAYRTNTQYSKKEWNRFKGYNELKDDGKYYFDCSGFCSYVLNKTYGLDLTNKNEDTQIYKNKQYYQPWVVLTYLQKTFTYNKVGYSYKNYVVKTNSIFKVIDYVTDNGDSIDISKLQIGDLIMGIRVYNNNGKRSTNNHIMIYTGEGYITHASTGKVNELTITGLDNDNGYSGIIHERLINSSKPYKTRQKFYTQLGNDSSTNRFNSIIAILRLNEKAI